MTGYSWDKKYWKKLISGLLLVSGSFLLLEHLFNFGGFDIELIGHEYLGIFLIIIAYLLSLKWEQMKGVITAWKDRDLHKLLDQGERD